MSDQESSAGEPMSDLQVLMKIGSGPGQRVKITKKRTAPIVGDVLEIMPFPYQKYKKLERVRVTEIKDVGEPLYLAERW